jgi:hypothetical protein
MTNDEKKQEIALRDKRYLLGADIAVQPPKEAGGYEESLWATGVKVLGYIESGDYQGTWWAYIEFPRGERFFVKDYYGSCSGCDAFQGEFFGRYVDLPDGGYEYKSANELPDYLHRLRDFGLEYLTDCRTYEQALEEAKEDYGWDTKEELVNWINTMHNNGGQPDADGSTPLTIDATARVRSDGGGSS